MEGGGGGLTESASTQQAAPSGPPAVRAGITETLDTFEGQSVLQRALQDGVQLALAGGHSWSAYDTPPFDAHHRQMLAGGRYSVRFDVGAVAEAVAAFSSASAVPAEDVSMYVIVKSPSAGLSAIVHQSPVGRGSGSVVLALPDGPEEYTEQWGTPFLGNPLYSRSPVISVGLSAEPAPAGGPVLWGASKLAEVSWRLSGQPERGGMFDIRELTPALADEFSVPERTAYYVDVDDLSAESADLSSVTVYVNSEVYHRFCDDGSEPIDTLVASQMATDVTMAAAEKLLQDMRADGSEGEAIPLLTRIGELAGVQLGDPDAADLRQLRAAVQAKMDVTGRIASVWARYLDDASATEGAAEEDYDD